jgi:hypothetical protein
VRGFRPVFHVAVWYVLRIATAGLGDSYGERPQPSTLLRLRSIIGYPEMLQNLSK